MRTVYFARCKTCDEKSKGLATKQTRKRWAEAHYGDTRHVNYKFWTEDQFTLRTTEQSG